MALIDLTFAETVQLISSFRKHPIVYDQSAIGYSDRKMKSEAWKAIGEEVGMRPDLCKRKMESLMSSYRREKKNAQKAKDSGDETFQLKWRYWNHFKFMRGLADDEEDPLGSVPDDIPEPKTESPWSIAKMLAHKYRDVAYPVEPIAKTNKKSKNVQEYNDECASIGKTVEDNLKKVSKSQRIYAENIINQILYKGLIFQLSHRSEIRDTNLSSSNTHDEPLKVELASVVVEKQATSHIENLVCEKTDEECHFSSLLDPNIPRKRRRDYSPNSMNADSPNTFKQMTIL